MKSLLWNWIKHLRSMEKTNLERLQDVAEGFDDLNEKVERRKSKVFEETKHP